MFSLDPFPPPDKAPIDELATCYGLVPGLGVQMAELQFRCQACKQMQLAETPVVWVPQGSRVGDPAWSITENCRLSAYNGVWCGWCLPCAKSLSPEPPKPEKPNGLLSRIRAALHRT